MAKDTENELLDALLDMGQLLLDCGAEISRVEDTLSRIGCAYGAERVECFVITSLISLSIAFPGERAITETRRIWSSAGTDFYRLEKLNDLSRHCCASPISPKELQKALEKIATGKKPFRVILGGSILAAGSFALFFGGSVWDGLVAAVFAVVICFLQRRLGETQLNTVASNLLLSLLVGLGVGLVCLPFPALQMDRILMGDIMLLIPGLAMTNAIRNMLIGNTISGVVRLTESLIWAAALAGGFMTALMLINMLQGVIRI